MKTASVIIAILLLTVLFLFLGWTRAPDLLANYLSKKLQVSVSIDDIKLTQDSIRIEGFEIDNPRGAILPKAFYAQEIGFFAPLTRYLHKDIVIDELTIDNVYLGVEVESPKNTMGNWTILMNNLQRSMAKERPVNKSVTIKRVVLTNINMDLVFRSEGGIRHLPPIERIVLNNVSSENGFAIDQLTKILIDHIVQELYRQQGLQNLFDALMNPSPENVLKFLGPLIGP